MDQVTADIPFSVRLPFLGLRKLGLFSTNPFKAYIPMTLLVLIMAAMIVIAMLQFINIKRDISDYVQNLEEILVFIMIGGKILIVTYGNKDFARLIEASKLFWDSNKCGVRTQAEINSIRHLIFRLQKLFLFFIIACLVSTVVFHGHHNHLLTGIWTMEGQETLYQFVLVGQVITGLLGPMFSWCMHSMHVGFCAETVIQFKMLSQYLEEITADGSTAKEMEVNHLNKLKVAIRHHNFILWFVRELQRVFSMMLLLEYVIDYPLICAELIAASESHSFQTQIRHATVFAIVTTQLSFFCIPANYISDKAIAVADAAYFSDWYNHNFPSLKVPTLLMIQNAQDGITIKAGGLVSLNAATVLNVLKVAWTTCSLVRGLRQN